MDTLVIPDFVSDAEREQLCVKAIGYRQDGILEASPSGPKRFRKKIWDTPYCDEQILDIGKRVVKVLRLEGFPVDPYLGWIISYIEPGGFIKPHIDRHAHYHETTDRHLRCNVLVQSEDESAFPIIGNTSISIKERSLWAFFASEHVHGTKSICGDLPRIVYQFGFTVSERYRLPLDTNM